MKRKEKGYYRIAYFVWYILLVTLYAGATWGIKGVLISNHVDWFMSVSMLLFYPLIYLVFYQQYTLFIEREYDQKPYYTEKFTYSIKLRYADFSVKKCVLKSVIWLTVGVVLVYVVASWNNTNMIYDKVFNLTHSDKIEIDISSMFLGIYSVVLALITLLNLYLEKRCLFFEGNDLSLIRWLRNLVIISVLIGTVVFVFYYVNIDSKNYKKLFSLSVLIWFGLLVLLFFLYLLAFVGPIKTERKLLDKIERYYSVKTNLRTPNKKWSKAKVVNALIYLIDSYKKNCKKIELNDVEEIHFSNIFTNGEHLVVKVRMRIIMAIVYFVGMFYTYMQVEFLGQNKGLKWSWFALAMIGPIVELIIGVHQKKYTQYRNFIYSIMLGSWWGYFLKLKGHENSLYITSMDFLQVRDYIPIVGKRKYKQYILSLKRIICFWNLACDMIYEDIDKFQEFGVECLCAYASDVKARGEKVEHVIAPIVICICLRGNISDESYSNIQNTFQDIIIDEETVILIKNICLEMLRDIYGDDKTFDKMEYQESIERLLAYIT